MSSAHVHTTIGDVEGAHRAVELISEESLAGLSTEDAMDLVRKDAVWPQPDWRELVADGADPRAVALMKLVRDRIPGKPNYKVRQLGLHYSVKAERKPELVQRDYVKMLGIVRDRFMECRSLSDVRAARSLVLADAGWTERAGADTKHLVTSVWRDRLDTLQLDYKDMMTSEAMVHQGWPGAANPSWRKGHSVRGDGEGGYLLARGIRVIQDGFLTEDAAWDWLRADAESKRQSTMLAPLPARPKLELLERYGLPDWRGGHDVDVLEFLDSFGMRAVEFGKWVPQAERQDLLNRTFDALHDLPEALGVDAGVIGLGSSLALSFGARAGGSVGADYDPKLRVIALPRASGAGELARCWAKAFDHWAGELGLAFRPPVQRTATGRIVRGREPVPELSHLDPGEAMEWWRVHMGLWRANPDAAAEAATIRAELALKETEAKRTERQRDAFLQRNPDAESTVQGTAYLTQTAQWLQNRRDNVIPALQERLQQAESLSIASGESAYALQARKLNGRDGDYWTRPTEMFARAFEAVVADRLSDMGVRNDFLVHGVEEARFSQAYRGNPFPTGAERASLGQAIMALSQRMAARLESSAPDVSDEVAQAPRGPLGSS